MNSENIVVDEWMQQAIEEESLEANSNPVVEDTLQNKTAAEIIAQLPQQKDTTLNNKGKVKNKENILQQLPTKIEEQNYMNHFYKELFALQEEPNTKKVRIAYFGDSMTDGDMIVQDLRALLQNRFGGKGVGFVPITSESAASRGSIGHSFSKNWQEYTFIKTYDTIYPFGVSGQVFYQVDTTETTTLHFSPGLYAKGKPLQVPELYYGNSTNQKAKIAVRTAEDTTVFDLETKNTINKLSLTKKPTKDIDLEFIEADSIPIFGVNFDSSTGIYVDNFSKRGNSGLPLTQLNTELMHAFQKDLQYDLIILHYGTNVLSSELFKYGWYQARMERVVDHLREAFPKASILVISIADKATKYETKMQTDSAVTHLLAAQRAYAEKKKTGFVNLFHLMGGEGSMIEWTEEEPERANKDYTHFNHRGAKQIAKMIYDQMEAGFVKFVEKKQQIEAEAERLRIQDSIQKVEEEILRQKQIEERRLKQDTTYVKED